ncbi:hypothetical protein F2Q68_00010863 [Brassica cretica]|uniref:Uncharacterized protein n=1 Tax=Brassica cretica TaxID=69181 RepID=A0A8S9KQ67_BRACR|nr:hypothetical protein F2Q68_00010863 [Brassica cretica]
MLFLLGTDGECLFSSLWSLLDAFSRSSRDYHDLLASFFSLCDGGMFYSGDRLLREKGNDIATSPSPTRDVTANGSPLDEVDLIYRCSTRYREHESIPALLVADAHRQIREEGTDRVEVRSSDVSDSGSEASSQAWRPLRRVRRRRISSRVLKRSRRTAIFVGQISVESGYVVNKLGSPELIGSRGFLVFSVLVNRVCLCLLGSSKKILDKAREMEGVQDLSALLKGKLQLLSKKTTSDVVLESTNFEEVGASKGRDSIIVNEDIGAEPSALSHKKKKKSKKAKRRVTDEAPGADVPLGEEASLGEASKGSKAKKKKEGKKSPREGTTSPADHDDMPREGREATPEDLVGADLIEAVPEDRPKKKTKKRSVEAVPWPIADGTTPVDSTGRKSLSSETPLEKRRKFAASEGGSRSESAASERSAPDSATRRGARSEATNSEEAGASKGRDSIIVDEDISAEPSALSPKKKKKSKKAKRRVTDEAHGADVPLGEAASLGEASKGSKAKKKKEGKKRPREGTTSPADHDDMPREGREATPEDLVGADPIEAVPEDRPKKKMKKRSVEAVPRPIADGTTPVDSAGRKSLSPETTLEKRRKVAGSEGGSRSESAVSERSGPDSATRRGARSEGSLTRRGGAEFPDRVQFSYDEKTPLIFNPLRCAGLTRQIRGGTRELPQIGDLYFKDEYVDAAFTRARSDGSMNFLVEKYDSTLKQTMIQLGSSEKLAQARLKAIERVRAEHKKAKFCSSTRGSPPPVGRMLFLLGTDVESLFSSLWSLLDAFSRSSRVYHDLLASFFCLCDGGMFYSGDRLLREKGKDIATSPSPTRDVTANGSPLDEFDLIHRDALRDTENISLSQRLLVADAYRRIREEGADRVKVGSSDVSENFFESAQAIATHSHLRWPDLSREWICRQQARIARVDWELRLLCVLGPHKSRLSLFTRKQQKLLDKAREMEGVPDLSALLKGKLQLLSKKTISDVVPESTNSEEARASKGRDSVIVDEDIGAEPSGLSPKTKKKSKRAKRRVADGAPAKKKKERKKRLREEATFPADHDDMPREGREATPEDLVGADPIEAVHEYRPKKKTKKRSVKAVPRPIADGTTPVDSAGRKSLSPGTPLEKRRRVAASEGSSRSESAASERSAPDSATRRGARSEGSLTRRGGAEFPDRVQFSYNEKTPLIFNHLRCAELTRQIRGGMREMPHIGDLYFKDEYVDAAFTRERSDGSMNFLVEKYDSTLKQTMIQLGSSEKIAQARLKAIERVRAEHKKANEETVKEKEVLRVKFEELEGKLKSDRAAKKELAREKACLEQTAATLEKEKAKLLEERDAVVAKLIKERQRLKDSQNLEVTRERERVQAAMTDKANRCFGHVQDYFTHLDAFGKAKNLYGQASGMRKCLEMIKEAGRRSRKR